jgi:hypothetical protein
MMVNILHSHFRVARRDAAWRKMRPPVKLP